MKMVNKTVFAVITVFVVLTSVFGCGSNDNSQVQQKSRQEAKETQGVKETQSIGSKPENKTEPASNPKSMPKLKYLGHASIMITTSDNKVIYVDPYAGEDYAEPADVILVTHSHNDHNRVDKVKRKDGSIIITNNEALDGGQYKSFSVSGVNIKSVPAYNKNHPKDKCVGYVIEFDGIKLYHAGDTSKINEMSEIAGMNITYALIPIDGVYNMGPEEASESAKVINAKYNIPIHTGPNGVYSQDNIDKFNVSNKAVLKPGEIIELKAK